jgi:predicted nucleic acid-binding protein
MPSFPGSEIVVADTSPFIHLDRAGCLSVLPALFRVVRVPETVAAEIAAGRNRGLVIPDVVSMSWVRIEADRDDPAVRLQPGLDAGEIAALSVARAIAADLVLIDDRAGREAALRLGMRFVGTAGVLVLAKRRELIPAVAPLLDALSASGFRLGAAVRRQILVAAGEAP